MSWVVLAGLFLVAFWGGFHISGFFLDSCGTTLHDSFVRYVYTPVLSQKSLQLTKVDGMNVDTYWYILIASVVHLTTVWRNIYQLCIISRKSQLTKADGLTTSADTY